MPKKKVRTYGAPMTTRRPGKARTTEEIAASRPKRKKKAKVKVAVGRRKKAKKKRPSAEDFAKRKGQPRAVQVQRAGEDLKGRDTKLKRAMRRSGA